MLRTRIIIGAMLATAATACIVRPGTLDRSLVPGAQWTAVLAPTETSSLRGKFIFVRMDPPGQARVIFALAGGAPGAILPWHVHYGVCGHDGQIVGKPGNYPPLVFNSSGALDAAAQLPITLADGERYLVNVHASAADMKTVTSCSALVPDRGATTVADAVR